METLQSIDKSLFLFLNSFHTSITDSFFLTYTNSKSWIPVIVFMVFLLFKKNNWKQALIYFVIIGAGVGISDFVASGIMKPYFARLRPCHEFLEEMILVGKCGGMYGFASSHAANSFALFTGFSLAFKDNKKVFWFLLAWAILMGYSRIYVGVHYPGDVIVGALIGIVFPRLLFKLYNYIFQTKK